MKFQHCFNSWKLFVIDSILNVAVISFLMYKVIYHSLYTDKIYVYYLIVNIKSLFLISLWKIHSQHKSFGTRVWLLLFVDAILPIQLTCTAPNFCYFINFGSGRNANKICLMPMTFRSTNTSCYFQWRRIGFESPYSTCDVLKEKEMQIRSNQTNKDKIHNGSIFI